ncbi:MAG TPA: sugar ABC transporter ATP-binding protein [Ktedonobacteraceae bacterium]|nr:sugar ABC transporter ATP-binding protein [Ktedonobacteraceae bacterium]
MANSDAMLEAEQIRKSYGGIAALKGVDFRVHAGSVHALVGENGAGKSTLVKILSGATSPDTGVLRLAGQEVRFSSTASAAAHGVAVVSQELNLFLDLDVLANLFPMRELRMGPFVSRKRMWEQAEPVLQELALAVEANTLVEELTLEQRQLLEIARALMVQPRVLILDEPTSALHAHEAERLHQVLRTLRQREVAVVYISHVLEDVLSLCDEVTVLRDGECVMDARPASLLSIDEAVHAMLGTRTATQSSTPTPFAEPTTPAQGALRIEHVSVPGRLEDVTLEAPAGMIIGLAGLSGSGYRDVLSVAAGMLRPAMGRVLLSDGNEVHHGLGRAIRQGIALVPGDRQRVGLMIDKPIWDNVAQIRAVALHRSGMFLRTNDLRERARMHVKRLGIKASSVDQEVAYLSGGNQQKVVFAKWLEAEPSILLLDDPTRGIDVGARAEIYSLMRELAEQNIIQILASTDPRELVSICDRVFVFYSGRICAVLEPPHIDAHTILEVANTGTFF